MPSNKELIASAVALGAELSVAVDTDGLNNAQLTELVAELSGRKTARDAAPPPPAPDGSAAPAPAAQAGGGDAPAGEQTPLPPPPVDGAAVKTENGQPPPPPAPELEQLYEYQVAKGKSLVTLRGVLGPGHEIRPSDISTKADALEHLERLVVGGHVTKRVSAKT